MKICTLTRVPLVLKKALPAVLLLACLSLAVTPCARAQMTLVFDYNISNANATTIRLQGSFADPSFLSKDATGYTSQFSIGEGGINFRKGDQTGMRGGSLNWSLTSGSSLTGNLIFDQVPDTTIGDRISLSIAPGYNVANALPSDYIAGASIDTTLIFNNTPLTSLGLLNTNGGTFTAGTNSVTWSVTAVPEPSTYALFAVLAC